MTTSAIEYCIMTWLVLYLVLFFISSSLSSVQTTRMGLLSMYFSYSCFTYFVFFDVPIKRVNRVGIQPPSSFYCDEKGKRYLNIFKSMSVTMNKQIQNELMWFYELRMYTFILFHYAMNGLLHCLVHYIVNKTMWQELHCLITMQRMRQCSSDHIV